MEQRKVIGFRKAKNIRCSTCSHCSSPQDTKNLLIELATSQHDAIDALSDLASDFGGAAEDWGTSTNILCAKCSYGTPHEHERMGHSPAHPHCGLAARDDAQAEAIIKSWMKQQPHADVVRWYDADAATDGR